MPQRGPDKRLRNVYRTRVEFAAETLLQGAEVDADPYRDLLLLRRPHDRLHPVARADVAGVDPERVRARLNRRERAAVVEVDVRHERNRRPAPHLAERLRRLDVRNREPEDVAAERGALRDLRGKRRRVVRVGVRHRLDAHRRPASDGHSAYFNCSRCPSHWFQRSPPPPPPPSPRRPACTCVSSSSCARRGRSGFPSRRAEGT